MKIRINTPLARIEADLQEDQVKDLLRIALQYATGGQQSRTPSMKELFKEPWPYEPAPKVFIPDDKPKPNEDQTETDYKGFLYIKCEACGNTKGFCAKTPIKEARCDCGHATPLKDLKPLYVHCKCGESFKYRTNLTDDTATINCIKCGSPVDLEYHGKKNVYETIK